MIYLHAMKVEYSSGKESCRARPLNVVPIRNSRSSNYAASAKRPDWEASQPLRSRTGGSTFKNPAGHKAWALIDSAGCRGLSIGDAQVSEKHCNFLLNLGNATSAQIEDLGEEVRRRVMDKCNILLEWEIQRIGSYD